ncbi:MAG: glycosyltransferase [Planctomycetota bacterium]|nr:glycosyltransferase [Planctomycetota bacterium]
MPSPAPEPLTSRPLSVWLVDPFDDIPGEGIPPLRYWSLARVLVARGHDVTWWTATWSHRRKTIRTAPLGIREDEGFAVRLVATRPYQKNVSLARINSHKDFGRTFERLASEGVSSGQLGRPDIILASLPPLEGPEAALRLARRLDATFILDVQDLWPETFERLVPGPAFLRQLIAPLLLGNMAARRQAVVAGADALSAATHAYAAGSFADAPADAPRHVCYVGAYVDEFPGPPRAVSEVAAAGEGGRAGYKPAPTGASEAAGVIRGLFSAAAAGASSGPLECVYAGSLEAGQDIEILPAAARQLSAKGVAATIHVAGSGKQEAALRRAAEAATGSCRMVVHGLLGREEYVRLLARCEVGLSCVKPESMVAMPNKACDYAAAGLAIVNSLPGELAAMLEQYDAGVGYTAGDAGSLAGAIAGLAADRGRLMAMRQAARRMAERELDREKTYAAFADWIETIHGGG